LIKALIIQPGATDELYFRPRKTPWFSNPLSSWLEAVRVFTNHPSLQVVFNPPFLLLKRPTDRVNAGITVAHSRWHPWLAKPGPVATHWVIADEHWEQLQPQLHRMLKVPCSPAPASASAAHFYRAFVSGWNLSRPEILAAVCLATQTAATLEKRRIIFQREPPVGEPKGKTP
jgi:hypothetical protein